MGEVFGDGDMNRDGDGDGSEGGDGLAQLLDRLSCGLRRSAAGFPIVNISP